MCRAGQGRLGRVSVLRHGGIRLERSPVWSRRPYQRCSVKRGRVGGPRGRRRRAPVIDSGLDLLLPVEKGTETVLGYECDHLEYYGSRAGAELQGLPRAAQEALQSGGGELTPEKALALLREVRPADLRGAVGRLRPDQRRLEREVWVAKRLGRAIRHVAHGLNGGRVITEFTQIREGDQAPALFQAPPAASPRRTVQIEAGKTTEGRSTLPAQ